jgi:glycosyltransferase involved in cell wall biosynthesis
MDASIRGGAGPKVLIVTQRLDLGGTEKHLVRILPRLRAEGIDASLFVLSRGGQLEPQLAAAGVPLAGPPASARGRRNLVRAWWTLLRHLRAHKPGIAHFFLPEPYLVGSLAALAAGTEALVMSRRSLAHYQARHPILARLEWRLHRRARALIANSTAVLAELARETDDVHKLGLIFNGVELPVRGDAQARLTARQRFGVAPDALLLAIVANLIGYKGHGDLLEALARAGPKLPAGWRLLVAGRDDGEGATLRMRAAALGLAGNVIFAGERPDADAVYAAADIFVLASHEEGFSNSLLEAMAHGLPVVATAVGGNLDAVVAGETGLLVPVHTPAAMAAAIVELAIAPGLRTQLGEAARRRIERLFSLDACVAGYANLYRGLAGGLAAPVRELIAATALAASPASGDPGRAPGAAAAARSADPV